ncbi:MAG: PAS domain-containing sensor histidine kinase [Bacteroidota bacterium]
MNIGNLFKRRNGAGRITTIYIFFGVLWILFSDKLVAFLLDDPASITQIQTYKGWFFVLASGALIYSIVSPVLKNLEKAQTSIKEKEIIQKDLLNRHYQPLWQTDELGHCILSNQKWMNLTGISLPPHKPFSWITAAHPDDKTDCIQKFTDGFLSKEAFSFSYRILTKEKKYRWFVNSCFPYHNAQNDFLGMICLLFDIHDSKKLEIEYKQNFIWYKNLFWIHPSPMLIYNTNNLKILDVNETALQKYGFTRKEFLQLTFDDLLLKKNNDKNLSDHLYDETYKFEKTSNTIHKTKSGETFHAQVSGHEIPDISEKNKRLILIRDITKELRIQQEKEFQSYFLELIINNIPFPLFYKDEKGVYKGCNISFCNFLNKSKQEIIGRTVFDIFDPKMAQEFHQKDVELLKNKTSQQYETLLKFPDGRKMNAVFHKKVFMSQEKQPMGIIGVYFDITERVNAEAVIQRQMEELSKINTELERFSYTVSHDLRSPLITIQGFLSLLREDIKDGNFKRIEENMSRIEDATEKMHQLIEGILSYSRLGKQDNCFQQVSMSKIAKEAASLLHGISKIKNCKIDIHPDMGNEMADKTQIRELFQNLIENAIKFSGTKKDNIVSIFSRYENGKNTYCVKDQGIGINPENQQKIFELFSRCNNDVSGNGLGLALVKHIIDKHHGTIWVESEGADKGSVFCFTLNAEDRVNTV